jgi:superfamily I DNA/RNA helicase
VDRGLNRYADFAVLYRSNTLGRDLEMELRGQGVKHRVLGGTAFFDRKEVKDLHAYLRLCENPSDEISLRRVINFPPRGIGPRTLEKLSTYAERESVPLMTALDRAGSILTDDDRSAKAVNAFRELLRRTADRVKRGGDLKAGVNGLIADLDLGAEIQRSSESPKVMERRLELVNSVVAGVTRYTEKAQKPNLREYLSHVALLDLDADQEEDRGDLVTLSTLHGAKGLDWSVVVLIGLEEGLLPHDRTLNPSATDMVSGDVAEERRLCYVGMTRARDELILSRAAQRRVRGRPMDRTPSRFLDALPVETLQVEDLSKVASAEQVTDMVAALRSKLGW